MAMYIVDRHSCYGTAELPDMDPACETQPEIVCLMEEIYRARMQKAISERGFTWFPEPAELGLEQSAGASRPDVPGTVQYHHHRNLGAFGQENHSGSELSPNEE